MLAARTTARLAGWLALLAFAVAVRMLGIGFLLPSVPEPDGVVLTTQVESLELQIAEPEKDQNFGFYPLLVAGITVATTRACDMPAASAPLVDHLRAASDRHLRIRTVVALLSALAVPATWLVARRLMGELGAWIAATFQAASFLSLWFAQQARPHAAAASFTVLAVLAAMQLARTGRPHDYLLCGIAAGLAIGSLQSGLAALVPLAAAVLLRSERARETSLSWLLATLAIVAACVRLFYPFLFLASQGRDAAQLGIDETTFNLSGHLVALQLFNGRGFVKVADALRGYEPWLASLAALGVVLALFDALRARREGSSARAAVASSSFDRRRDLWVVLAYVVPYLLAIGLYERTYQRFVLPLLPFVACAAAFGVVRIAQTLRAPMLVGAFAAVCLAPEIAAAGALARLRAGVDTVTRMAQWVRASTPDEAGRIVLMPTVDLPLVRSPRAMSERDADIDLRISPWYRYQVQHPLGDHPGDTYDIATMPMYEQGVREAILVGADAYVRGLNADLVVIEVFEHRPVLAALREALARSARLVQRVSPDREGDGIAFTLSYQDDEYPELVPWMWRVLRAKHVGPTLEAYSFAQSPR